MQLSHSRVPSRLLLLSSAGHVLHPIFSSLLRDKAGLCPGPSLSLSPCPVPQLSCLSCRGWQDSALKSLKPALQGAPQSVEQVAKEAQEVAVLSSAEVHVLFLLKNLQRLSFDQSPKWVP